MIHPYEPEEDKLCPICLCANRDCKCVQEGRVEEFDFSKDEDDK